MNLADTDGTSRKTHARIGVERWGALPGGDAVRLFTLRNAHDMRVTISDLGATLVAWHAPDRAGRIADVLLGHDTPADYLAGRAFMGGTIGRWANRIAGARFTLDGVSYSLDRNDGAEPSAWRRGGVSSCVVERARSGGRARDDARIA